MFIVSFIAIIPLEKMFDFGGEQMALYLGRVRVSLTLSRPLKVAYAPLVVW